MSLHRRTFKLLGITVSMHQQCDGRLSWSLLHSNDHEIAIWRHASASAIWTFVMFQLNNSKFSQACRVVRAKIEETLGISSNYGAKELGHIYVQLFTTKPSWLYKHISLSLSLAKHLTSRPCTDGHETTSQKNVTALDREAKYGHGTWLSYPNSLPARIHRHYAGATQLQRLKVDLNDT